MKRSFTGLTFVVMLLTALLGCKEAPPCGGKGIAADISGNHGHALVLPPEALKESTGGTYALRGGSHEHVVILKDAQLKSIAGGAEVTTRASSVNAHTHEVIIACAK